MSVGWLYLVAVMASLVSLVPPLWALFVSLSEPGSARFPSLVHYREILGQWQFWHAIGNSLLAALLATVVSMLLGAMAAYGMTRFRRRWEALALAMLALRMIPGIVLVIPFYLLFRDVGLLDSVFGLAITYLTFSIPFAIWMLRGFLLAVPVELDEAAALDGAGSWTILWRVLVPAIAPAALTTAVLIFCFCWNEFLFALILTDRAALTFLPLLMRYVPPQGPLYGQIFAGSTLFLLIPLVALTLVRRHLEGSFVMGSVK